MSLQRRVREAEAARGADASEGDVLLAENGALGRQVEALRCDISRLTAANEVDARALRVAISEREDADYRLGLRPRGLGCALVA